MGMAVEAAFFLDTNLASSQEERSGGSRRQIGWAPRIEQGCVRGLTLLDCIEVGVESEGRGIGRGAISVYWCSLVEISVLIFNTNLAALVTDEHE